MAATMQLSDFEWHSGEYQMQEAMHAPHPDNPTVPALSPQLANHIRIAPLISIGTLDAQGQPWTTLWGGEQPLGQAIGPNIIGIKSNVTRTHDPVIEQLFGKEANGEVIRESGKGRMISGVTIDLETRKRVKFFGRMVAGALSSNHDAEMDISHAEAQLVLKVEQSLGNCPKYLNSRHIIPSASVPTLSYEGSRITGEALELINNADLFFVTSSHGQEDMDTNHRGGPAGFVRCSNDGDQTVLYWPEYSGNRFYQTLGNLMVNPLAGLTIPDFDKGDMLYMTGRTEILVAEHAAVVLPKTNLAVKFTVSSARFVQNALPFRGVLGQRSPYNPTVRYLTTEKKQPQVKISKIQATLLSQDKLTNDISRYRFALPVPADYKAGQYVTFDFSSILDIGYSHMRDDDPRSLNDDYVRTFTVSSTPSAGLNEFEITIRHVGVVTNYMSKFDGAHKRKRPMLEVDINGFGGEFEVSQLYLDEQICFIAAGVGITPLLPALSSIDTSRLRLLWTVRARDIPFVQDTLERYPSLLGSTRLFVTGIQDASADLARLQDLGIVVHRGRLTQDEVTKHATSRTYICAAAPLRHIITTWIPDKELIYEDFNF